jgi:hypothetical protein
MRRRKVRLWAIVLACATLSACSGAVATETGHSEPFTVQQVGAETHLTLTERAIQRLDLQTAPVSSAPAGQAGPVGGKATTVIPYAAVLFDEEGRNWVYKVVGPRTFVRHPITVQDFSGDLVVLTAGPPVGTRVVAVGATELFGAEFDVS